MMKLLPEGLWKILSRMCVEISIEFCPFSLVLAYSMLKGRFECLYSPCFLFSA